LQGKHITISEVGPRDGFQNVKELIPFEVKTKIIDLLVDAGVSRIQAASFVNPKYVPQMADSAKVSEYALSKYKNRVDLFALVPNMRGADAAVSCGYEEITFVLSASDTHNKENTGKTTSQALEELKLIRNKYKNIKLDLDISTAFHCVFEGETDEEKLFHIISRASDIGVDCIDLCDTTGGAYPKKVKRVVSRALEEYKNMDFEVHMHDTWNMGMLNTYEAISCGITSAQAALSGLGGCPFAPGAAGNTATEDLVFMLMREGIETGIDFEKLMDASQYQMRNINGNFSGHQIASRTEKCV